MELRAFCKAVLFAETLEGKLLDPGPLEDRAPGAARTAAAPGRPPELRWAPGERAPFPGATRLDDPRAAGQVLHAFANHELEALELMALTLLRFPDAPAAFRRELAETLREEQRHLGLYLERLEALGVGFGELPVNGFLWSCLAEVGSPLAFVTRMSLTFEQANLDYALRYAQAFRVVGDLETARVLEEVYRDEVGHVRTGVAWFREWTAGEDEWDAYRRHLGAPLTPTRAKGPGFSAAARRAAGLSERFIAELRACAASKGRPPRVLWFDPGADDDLGRPGRAPDAATRAVAADLAPLFGLAARSGDALAVPRAPSRAHTERLLALGLDGPEPVASDLDGAALRRALAGRRLASLEPWGWCPRARDALAPLEPQLVGEARVPTRDELETLHRRVRSKEWSAELLVELADAEPAWAGAAGLAGRPGAVAHDRAAVDAAIAELAAAGAAWVGLKAPHGASGRGARRAEVGRPVDAGQTGWIERTLREQGALVVEPWLDRAVDLSVQLHVDGPGAARVLGVGRFLTDRRGQYEGAVLGRAVDDLDPAVRRALAESIPVLRRVGAQVGRRLAEAGYRGPAGVDALLARVDGALRVRPLVEVNPRWTMGRLAHELARRHLRPGAAGLLRLLPVARLGSPPSAFAEALAAVSPPRRVDDRLGSGAVCLTDPARAEQVLPVLVAGRSVGECAAALSRATGRCSSAE